MPSDGAKGTVSDEDSLAKEAIEFDQKARRANPNKWEEAKRSIKHDWSMPISFYGKVVDETGSSIAGAKIKFAWTDLSPSGASHQDAVSDVLGLFKLEGVHGKNLGVSVAKEGYFASHRDPPGFEYADHNNREFHVPNPANPVIFHLRKKAAKEQLVYQSISKNIPYDQAVAYYNLQTGAITQEAPTDAAPAIKIGVTRTIAGPGEPHEWSCAVEALNGGVCETTEEFPFLAPEEGYVPSWMYSASTASPGFKGTASVSLYVRTNGGDYGRLEISATDPRTREQGAFITVDSFLNVSGSRVLQPKLK